MSAVAPVVDWARVEQVAIKVAGRSRAPDAHVEGWDPPIGLIERHIEDVTGLRSAAGTASAHLIDRPTWIRANITSLRQLLDPVLSKLPAQRLTSGFAAGTLNSWSQQMAGAQLGMMLGWMGGRVLGQYDDEARQQLRETRFARGRFQLWRRMFHQVSPRAADPPGYDEVPLGRVASFGQDGRSCCRPVQARRL